MLAAPDLLRQVGLSEDEYRLIVERLGREPGPVELGMLGAMWSEHCGYKNSRPLLKLLPTTGPRVVQGPGENAGAVDIGDGLVVVLKMESHNHPSAIEPYQGAATGVGGILRDIFTMGARPVALLDSLRFGPPGQGRNSFLFNGVVAGISGYGNCVGVPTVGGELYFDESYSSNPLVNVMCVGVAERWKLTRARASGVGNPVLLVGADTGRDGIHGATFASAELDDTSEERRPAVQVGNPFLEKLLLEACLELAGDPDVVAMQDLGAAGLTSSSVEMAARGGCGIELDVWRVPRREEGMTPYEVMLSESQERMLLVVRRGAEDRVRSVFRRWGLRSDVVGYITDDGMVRVRDGHQLVAELPVRLLTEDVPTYVRDTSGVRWAPLPTVRVQEVPEPRDMGQVLVQLLASPNLCSRALVYTQYDHTVQGNTVVGPGLGAAVLRIRGTTRGLAVTTDCNSLYCLADPRLGAQIAVAEAARNLVCRGAEPLAATDCLNFGSPERLEVYYSLREAVTGLAEACRALGIPVVSGNVSLYNETNGEAVNPTPIVGMVGLLEDVSLAVGPAFRSEGDMVFLLGPVTEELGCSEYLRVVHGLRVGPVPSLDLSMEGRVQGLVLDLARRRLLASAQDVSDGGLAVALAECCMAGGQGFRAGDEGLALVSGVTRLDAFLFGEGQSRVVISCDASAADEVLRMAAARGVPCHLLGTVGGSALVWGPALSMPIEALRHAWDGGLRSW